MESFELLKPWGGTSRVKPSVVSLANQPDSTLVAQRVIEYYKRRGLKTEDDVYLLATAGLQGTVISTKHICLNEDHCPPFAFVADILLDRIRDYIVWANRAGSKSYLAGLVTWVKSGFMPRLETNILAGSLEQSEKSYKAMNDFWKATALSESWLISEPGRQRTVWKNLSEVAVLTASTKSARGPHPQHLILDEIDEMADDVYKAALSQPQAKYGIRSSLGRLSTNHRIDGVMDRAITLASESKAMTTMYKWCIFECLEPCVDYACSTCPISMYCPGEQMKQADGYYKIEDFVAKLYNCSAATISLEWLCIKVGRDDLVYGAQYDKGVHSTPDLPGFDPARRVRLSIDWGGTNPFSVGVWQEIPKLGHVRVDEVYMANTTNSRVIQECKKRPWWKKIDEGVADPSRPDLIKEWMEEGIDIVKAKNDIEEGIEATRDALAPVLGKPKIYIHPICRAWRREVDLYYEKNGRPVKENDHAMDETRYYVLRYIKETGGPRARRT